MPLYNNLIRKVQKEKEEPGSALKRIKEIGISASKFLGPDPESPTFIQEVGQEFLEMYAHKNPYTYMGSQILQNVPAIKQGKKYLNQAYTLAIETAFSPARRLADWGKRKVDDLTGLYDIGTGLGPRSSDVDITKHRNYFKGVEEFPEKWQRLFLEGGYPERTYEVYKKSGIENKKFVLDTWQRLGSDREAIALVGNPIYSDRTFEATRAALLPDFLEELGNVPGIKPELHHIFSLRASAPLFDGLTVGSQKWKNLIRTLVSEGVYPGNNPQNLKLIADLPHDVVHKYLDDVIGRQGEIFFDSKTIKFIGG